LGVENRLREGEIRGGPFSVGYEAGWLQDGSAIRKTEIHKLTGRRPEILKTRSFIFSKIEAFN
jgi:hypothetical protein